MPRTIENPFFSRIAPHYAHRRAEHRAFFCERAELALQQLELGKTGSILDIGAGTGILYDALQEHGFSGTYDATDIEAAMLEQSRIPENCRHVGPLYELKLSRSQWDGICCLGVSTYLSREALLEMLEWMTTHLTSGGRAVFSFTHRKSLDWHIRCWINRWLRFLIPRRYLLAQRLPLQAYTPQELIVSLPSGLISITTLYFHPAFTPFHQLLPHLWNRLWGRYSTSVQPGWLSLPFYGDFLLVVKKR